MYRHTLVKSVLSYMSKYSKDTAPELTWEEREKLLPFHDGMLIPRQLHNFMAVLRNQMRGIEFGINAHCGQEFIGGRHCYVEVWAYFPNEPYLMGRIGYGDPTVNKDATSKQYWVYSRTISNQKFAEHRDQYYMKTGKDLGKMVKEAKRHLRPYSPVECAQETASRFLSSVSDGANNVRNRQQNAEYKIKTHDNLFRELKHLYTLSEDEQYQFLSSDLRSAIGTLIKADEEWRTESVRPVPAAFVSVNVIRGEQRFDVVEVDNAKGTWSKMNKTTKYYYNHDIPEDLMGKLSVLSILDVGGYTERVGQRVSETMFWVELDQ